MTSRLDAEQWERLEELVRAEDAPKLDDYLSLLPPGEVARAISRIDSDLQGRILALLSPQKAADLILELPETQSKGLLERVTPAQAAAILDRVPSDEQADLLGRFDEKRARAIVACMSPREAQDAAQLARYPIDTAGGRMITEYLAYREDSRVADVIIDLRRHVEEYANYELRYLYVIDELGRLAGVLRVQDLLFAREEEPLTSILLPTPHVVAADTRLEELRSFFDRHAFAGAPVIDGDRRLLGVVLRADVEEAIGEQADRSFLRLSGLLVGDEFRTMPLGQRFIRRLPWLALSIVLNLLAASVVGLYQETLKAVIALAVFLPVISGLGGNSGNQALAVSVRELSLGLIKPHEIVWAVLREAMLGIFTGFLLGLFLGATALLWTGSLLLGLLVGGAMTLTILLSVSVGGTVPLLLKRWNLDPALASGPITTTLTDVFGFFITLATAAALLPWLMQ